MNKPTRKKCFAILIYLLDITNCSRLALAQERDPASAQLQEFELPITTPNQLIAYLEAGGDAYSPLGKFPPGARERFVKGLRWGSNGITSFDAGILADELTQSQIEAVLAMFGADVVKFAPKSKLSENFEHDAKTMTTLSDLERRYNEFYLSNLGQRTDIERSISVVRQFDALLAEEFEREHLKELDDRHISMLWSAAQSVTQETTSTRHVDSMTLLLGEIVRRGKYPYGDYVIKVRNALLSLKMFTKAEQLLLDYPSANLPKLPEFRDMLKTEVAVPSVWRMSKDGAEVDRQVISLSGTKIFVTAGCHFSVEAAEDIVNDEILGPVFAKHAKWLMLPPGNEDIDAIQSWNLQYPQAEALMIYDRKEWSFIEKWTMPKFHIVRDGQIMETFEGWARGDKHHRDALIEMLAKADLL